MSLQQAVTVLLCSANYDFVQMHCIDLAFLMPLDKLHPDHTASLMLAAHAASCQTQTLCVCHLKLAGLDTCLYVCRQIDSVAFKKVSHETCSEVLVCKKLHGSRTQSKGDAERQAKDEIRSAQATLKHNVLQQVLAAHQVSAE